MECELRFCVPKMGAERATAMPNPVTHSKPCTRPATVKQAAEHWGVSTKTIRRMINAGTITGYKLTARTLRVNLDELDSLAQSQSTDFGGF